MEHLTPSQREFWRSNLRGRTRTDAVVVGVSVDLCVGLNRWLGPVRSSLVHAGQRDHRPAARDDSQPPDDDRCAGSSRLVDRVVQTQWSPRRDLRRCLLWSSHRSGRVRVDGWSVRQQLACAGQVDRRRVTRRPVDRGTRSAAAAESVSVCSFDANSILE